MRFPYPDLLELLRGKQTMIKSPLITELIAEKMQKAIFIVLKSRFGSFPLTIRKQLRTILKERHLKRLNITAATCKDIEAFLEELLTYIR
jgi:hypothetical protein